MEKIQFCLTLEFNIAIITGNFCNKTVTLKLNMQPKQYNFNYNRTLS